MGTFMGWADDATLAFRETEADEDPGSLWPGSGYFTVKMNVNTLSYTIETFDESSATDYASITISEDFNGWGDDALTANAFNPHIWSLVYTFADDTNLKFKIGESWGVNWGLIVMRQGCTEWAYRMEVTFS